MVVTCTPLPQVAMSADSSAYAEFWLNTRGYERGTRKTVALESAEEAPAAARPAGDGPDTIAHEILDPRLLVPARDDPRWDTITADPTDYDPAPESDARFAYLDDRALPQIDEQALAPGSTTPPGAAIIGIIDDAVPFAHELLTLRDADGRRHSRVASVWMQGARSLNPARPSKWPEEPVPAALRGRLGFDRTLPPVGADLLLGRELRGGQIDTLLNALGTPALPDEGALYRAAGAIDMGRPSPPGWARAGSHGAAVAIRAAGFAPTDPQARQFPVIAVCLPPEVTRDTMGSLGPFFIVLAYLHILRRAERLCRVIEASRGYAKNSLRLPVAINLSYGVTAGPKDGQSLLERFQDELSKPGGWPGLGPVRCILPAGNHRQARLHARLEVSADDTSRTLRWNLRPDDASPNALEIWGPEEPPGKPLPPLMVELRPPGAADFTAASPQGDGWVSLASDGTEIARLRLIRHATTKRVRHAVTLILHPTVPRRLGDPVAPPGEWQLRLSGLTRGPVDVTIQRDETISGFRWGARQSVLEDENYRIRDRSGRLIRDDPDSPASPVRRRGTLNAYATGEYVVRVGGAVKDLAVPGLSVTEQAASAVPAPAEVAAAGAAASAEQGAPYSGMDDAGLGGSPVAAADTDLGVLADAPAGARWTAACERSSVRGGVIACGVLSGSRQILRGTSLAAPQVTRFLARRLAGPA